MNEILDRQNRPKFLKILFASRIFYNKAELANHLVWGLTIAAPIVSIVCNVIKKDATPSFYVVVSVLYFVSLLIEMYLHSVSKKAASLRIFFCNNVLGFDECNNSVDKQWIYETAEKVFLSNEEKAKTQMTNSSKDEPPGVKDWYVIPPNCNDPDAVFACQKYDAWFDKKIRKACTKWVVAVMIGVILIISLGSILLHCSFLFLVYSSLGLIGKTVWQAVSWGKYYSLSMEIEGIIKTMSINHTKQQEQYLQQKLNKRRKIPVFHLNQVHIKGASKLTTLYESTST